MTMLALPAAEQDRGRAAPQERARDRSITRIGVLVYAVAVAMVEVGLVGAYLSLRSSPGFRPDSYHEDNYLGTVMSLTLLLSAVTAEWFVWAVRHREQRQATYAGGLTALFGLAFLNAHTYMLRSSDLGAGSSTFGVLFWAFMLYNGLLVALGLGALLVGLLRAQGLQSSADEPETVRAAAWMWHLAVAAWVVTWFYVFFLFKN